MNEINIQYYKSKIGELVIGSFEGKLCLLDYRFRKMREAVDKRIKSGLKAEFIERNDEVIEEAKKQIGEYLEGRRNAFDLPMVTVGTEFQEIVWNALMKVPYGETSSYAELAKGIKKESAVRAVASANGANAMSLVIPCHRIIESNGGLGGYAGGVDIKKQLLGIERNGCL